MARLLLVLALALLACEGPVGPQGPQGEPGEGGPGTRIVLTGQLGPSGYALVELPPEAGTIDDPPVVGVYIASAEGATEWYAVSDGYGEWPWFALHQEPGHLTVAINSFGDYAGWYYRVVVIY